MLTSYELSAGLSEVSLTVENPKARQKRGAARYSALDALFQEKRAISKSAHNCETNFSRRGSFFRCFTKSWVKILSSHTVNELGGRNGKSNDDGGRCTCNRDRHVISHSRLDTKKEREKEILCESSFYSNE